MYLSHYNLVEKPFQISTDPKFLWLGEKHREALAVLKYGIINNQGFVLLTGDVGTGKTTLINAMVNSLDEDTIVAVVSDPKLDRMEFFNLITRAFKINEVFKDKLDFTLYFNQFLNTAYKENKKVLLIIDEAQNISLELLEEIRLLSNIEIPETKLLNVFFVGQNEFNNILMRNECRPLRQRITVTYNIKPLTENETSQYIGHRLKVAGTNKEIFTKGAINKIYSFSRGYPRLINIVCDHALLTGYVRDLTTITPKVVKECSKELSLPGEIKRKRGRHGKPQGEQTGGGVRKKALFYTCLLFLLIPLFYPPVSTSLKSYFASAVNFYDELFQQLAGPAHSHTTPQAEEQRFEEITAGATSVRTEETDTEIKALPEEVTRPDKSAVDKQAELNTKPFALQDCRLTIPFAYKANEVPESAHAPLERCAFLMVKDPSLEMVVRGYTDNVGSHAYNKQLSTFRANIVKSYLVGHGVSPERVKAVGMGEESPLESNMTKAGRRANRRVEVEVIAIDSRVPEQ